jgi:hypothetical protein
MVDTSAHAAIPLVYGCYEAHVHDDCPPVRRVSSNGITQCNGQHGCQTMKPIIDRKGLAPESGAAEE